MKKTTYLMWAGALPGVLAPLGAPPPPPTGNLRPTEVSAHAGGTGPGRPPAPDTRVLRTTAFPLFGTGLQPSADGPEAVLIGPMGTHGTAVLLQQPRPYAHAR